MLQPKKTKFRKFQKGRIGGIESNQNGLRFGKYGLQAMSANSITAKQIETVRRTLSRQFKNHNNKKASKIWIRVFPDIGVSKKPLEVRMGKGKGSPDFWMSRFSAGQILFEVDGVSREIAMKAFLTASYKLSFPIRLTERNFS